MTDKHVQENRRHPRVELPKGMWVAWEGGGQRLVSHVYNLSLGGVFIPTPEPPPAGTVVKLVIEVPGGEVRVRAVVRRTVLGRGMALEFTAMSHQDRARLQHLLKDILR